MINIENGKDNLNNNHNNIIWNFKRNLRNKIKILTYEKIKNECEMILMSDNLESNFQNYLKFF